MRLSIFFFLFFFSFTSLSAQVKQMRVHAGGNFYWWSIDKENRDLFFNDMATIENGNFGFDLGYSVGISSVSYTHLTLPTTPYV